MKFSSEWSVARLKDVIVDMQPGFAQRPGEEDGSIGQIRTHNVSPDGQITLNGLKRVTPSEAEAKKYLLEPGDIIFNNTNSEEWVGKTALYELEEPLAFSNHMTRIRANKALIMPTFLARYLHFLWSIGFSKTRAKRWVSQAGIDQKELSNFKVPLPTLQEQQFIVNILKQTDELRHLRRDFLEKERQLPAALFIEMFGDPDSRVNDRWKFEKLGNLTEVETGGTPSRTRPEYYIGEIAWIKSTELIDEVIFSSEERITEEALQASNTKIFPVDTILLAMYGQGQTRGRTGKLAIAATCNQAIAAILPSQNLVPDYVFTWLQCSYEAVRSLGRGGQQANINLSIVRNLKIPTPPIETQLRFSNIRSKIQKQLRSIATALEGQEHASKQALIEAFTGNLTKVWRELNLSKLKDATPKKESFAKRPKHKVTITEVVPEERPWLGRQYRRWLLDQLSEIQGFVYKALREWKGTLIPSEDLDEFMGRSFQIEHLEDANDQIKRALNQLAGLGLIAKISIPNQAGEYVTGYRGLREDELTQVSDRQFLARG